MQEGLADRVAALERAESFSELKRAMLALVEGGELEALDILLPRLIHTGNENLRALVGRAAAERWGDSILHRIDLGSLPPGEKANALSMCRWVGGDLARSMLIEGLSDRSPEVRAHAASLLGESASPDGATFEALEHAAVTDADPMVRKAGLRAIAATVQPEAEPILERIHEETEDRYAENLLIDLRLRLAEQKKEREAEAPSAEEAGEAEGLPPKPGSLETAGREALARARNVLDTVVAIGLLTVRSRNDPNRVSPGRVAALTIGFVLLAFAAVHTKNTLRAMNPIPKAEEIVCPVCGLHQKQILGPDARCEQCGAYFFANNPWERRADPNRTPTEPGRRRPPG